jgi:serine/threonine protein kinase
LKPANLMIGGSSYIESDMQRRIMLHELGCVKIADFGLSKSLKLNKSETTPEASRTGAGRAAWQGNAQQGRAGQGSQLIIGCWSCAAQGHLLVWLLLPPGCGHRPFKFVASAGACLLLQDDWL